MKHRRPLIAGNWKMHGTKASVESLLTSVRAHTLKPPLELAVFPPYVFLEQTQRLLGETSVVWGAQNLSEHAQGAFTGEVSGTMLREFGCQYVLIGHSERRTLYAENNEQIAAKFVAAQAGELIPILCVGETLSQRQSGETELVIAAQLDSVIKAIKSPQQLNKAVIAYEPVWAIGTGLSATPEQAQEVHAFIRRHLANDGIRILYGGSVKPDNASALFAMPDVDGGLIGGASLNAQDFLEIGKLCNNYY